jgi:toxin ParE1/3/4
VSWSLSPDAEEELNQAAAYYREQVSAALAAAFLDEFERAARLIVEHPGLGTPTSRGRRLKPLRRFPFSLLYRAVGQDILISAVVHQRRRPGYWRSRA